MSAILIVANRCRVPLLLLLIAGAAAWSQPANLDLVRDCAGSLADSAFALANAPTACCSVAEHPAAWLLQEAMVKQAAQRGVGLRDCGSSVPAITLAFTELRILYRNGIESETIARECRVTIAAIFAPTGSAPQRQQEFTAVRHDTVAASALPLIEQPGYDYLHGVNVAPPSSGFWDTVMEPAIVLGAAAVSVILLFTVRSN